MRESVEHCHANTTAYKPQIIHDFSSLVELPIINAGIAKHTTLLLGTRALAEYARVSIMMFCVVYLN